MTSDTGQSTMRRFDRPDEHRAFAHGSTDVICVGRVSLGLFRFEPGWRWSEDAKPTVHTGSCQVEHAGYILSGHLFTRMDDGTKSEAGPGDVIHVVPGKTAGWSVTSRSCSWRSRELSRTPSGPDTIKAPGCPQGLTLCRSAYLRPLLLVNAATHAKEASIPASSLLEWKVKPGREADFVAKWEEVAAANKTKYDPSDWARLLQDEQAPPTSSVSPSGPTPSRSKGGAQGRGSRTA